MLTWQAYSMYSRWQCCCWFLNRAVQVPSSFSRRYIVALTLKQPSLRYLQGSVLHVLTSLTDSMWGWCAIISSFLKIRKLRHKELMELAQVEWQNWNLNSGHVTPKLVLLINILCCFLWDNFRVLVNPDTGRGMGETWCKFPASTKLGTVFLLCWSRQLFPRCLSCQVLCPT